MSWNEWTMIEILISIMFGVIVGMFIGYMMFKNVLYKGPDSNEVIMETNEDNTGKYKWEPVITLCPIGTVHLDLD
jgi:uncharacterized protein YneF (UPF0154 family)